MSDEQKNTKEQILNCCESSIDIIDINRLTTFPPKI
jgi:hypothetical protein